jgi:protein SCO1/2
MPRARHPVLALALAGALSAAGWAGAAWGHGGDHPTPESFDRSKALAYSQDAIGGQTGDHRFLDSRGRPVQLADLRGRPLVVSLIYTSCAHTCPMVTQSLARAVEAARDLLGERSFAVATVGFDTRADHPARMRAFAREQGVALDDWWFLSADAATIEALTGELGFVFYASPRGFDHITQTTILDADGRVYAQVYGETFGPPAIAEPLKRLSMGRPAADGALAGMLERVRLVCTFYDPASDRYRLDYSLIIAAVVGFACLAAVAIFLLRAWRQNRAHGQNA